MKTMTIGCVAKKVGISTDSIRLYERYGLIDKPDRLNNGYRHYDFDAIRRLDFIKRSKAMGFTLNEIHELLEIQHTSEHACHDVQEQASIKLKKVNNQLNELQRMKNALETLVYCCEQNQQEQACPILDALENQDQKENQT